MAKFSKKSLSLFLRNGCEKQFILSLHNDTTRRERGLPPAEVNRAGLGLIQKAGDKWQHAKITELKDVFGDENIHISQVFYAEKTGKIDLLTTLPLARPFQFIVEAAYISDTPALRNALQIGEFRDYFNEKLDIGAAQPDLVQVLPSRAEEEQHGAGKPGNDSSRPGASALNPDYDTEVLPNGFTVPIPPTDTRLRLRVIDIKLTSEPGAHYFAEVVYYSMTLSGALKESGFDNRFVVVAAPAIWAGSHDGSNLVKQMSEWQRRYYQPEAAEMFNALEDDMEIVPFEVFAAPLRRLLTEQLPHLLAQPFEKLAWHVNFRCKGCEFLGSAPKDGVGGSDPQHCSVLAEKNGHLSQIPGLSRGAGRHLTRSSIKNIESLASTDPASRVFDEHQSLRAKRTIFPHRAEAIRNKSTSVIPRSGGDALMPRYPNLHIYLFLDYELSSAVTAAIGVRAFWTEPLAYNTGFERQTRAWNQRNGDDEVFLIDQNEPKRERVEFLKFLRHLKRILAEVRRTDDEDVQRGRRSNPANPKDTRNHKSTYQIYLWDEAQRRHLMRVVGRHLPYILADAELSDLAWLFPPPELLQRAEDATRRSPVTIVSTVVNHVIAVPVSHHYTLLKVAETYKPETAPAPHLHPLYTESMSDLMPSERIHEWWERIDTTSKKTGQTRTWHDVQAQIKQSSITKLSALSMVVQRLESDLKDELSRHAAPQVFTPPKKFGRLAPQSQMWLEFTRLNASMTDLEAHTIRVMPPHERESTTKSARLQRRLCGAERSRALGLLGKSIGRDLSDEPLLVYELRPGSREFNARPTDFQYALSPESKPGFLDESPYPYIEGTGMDKPERRQATFESVKWTSVSIVAIDRPNGLIALRGDYQCRITRLEMETAGNMDPEKRLDFKRNVILDKAPVDYLVRKLEYTYRDIGNPPCAVPDPRTIEAMGLAPNYIAGKSPVTPAAEFLWETARIHRESSGFNQAGARADIEPMLESASGNLNDSQWAAWEQALTRRFSIIWGPPGTGKSKTLRAVILGAVINALRDKRPLRLLITANTNSALDNVLVGAQKDLAKFLSGNPYRIYRVQGGKQAEPEADDAAVAEAIENLGRLRLLSLDKKTPSDEIKALLEELHSPIGVSVIDILPQQLHNLAIAGEKSATPPVGATLKEWFDLVMIDEASQMDTATAALVLTKIAPTGTCVLAGDNLQLAPIQKATPPAGLEDLVGSVYGYFRRRQQIEPAPLNINYRSNRTIVELAKLAGYNSALTSWSPDLRINLLGAIRPSRPIEFPSRLVWSASFREMLRPDREAVCFIYDDDSSGQTNDFEADNISALVWLLQKHLSSRLLNERLSGGGTSEPSSELYAPDEFWEKAVGIVTPHRSQMSKTVNRLQQMFPNQDPEAIRRAVDTVERFQGQQRDVIIASFGIGDVDIINTEEEFLYSLTRFNVLSSRARAKLIVFITKNFLQHLSNDKKVLEESRFLKQFASSYCSESIPAQLGFVKDEDKNQSHWRDGEMRFSPPAPFPE